MGFRALEGWKTVLDGSQHVSQPEAEKVCWQQRRGAKARGCRGSDVAIEVNGRSATTLQKLRRARPSPSSGCTSNSCSVPGACGGMKCIGCFPSGGHVRARMMELWALADQVFFCPGTTSQPSTASDPIPIWRRPVANGHAPSSGTRGRRIATRRRRWISAVPSVPLLLTRTLSGRRLCSGLQACDVEETIVEDETTPRISISQRYCLQCFAQR